MYFGGGVAEKARGVSNDLPGWDDLANAKDASCKLGVEVFMASQSS